MLHNYFIYFFSKIHECIRLGKYVCDMPYPSYVLNDKKNCNINFESRAFCGFTMSTVAKEKDLIGRLLVSPDAPGYKRTSVYF